MILDLSQLREDYKAVYPKDWETAQESGFFD